MSPVDVTDFTNALKTLHTALEKVKKAKSLDDEDLYLTTRDGAIQRFEFCYESAWKLIRRVLKDILAQDFVQSLSRKDLYRHAWEAGIITDPQPWFTFHEARNLTSHTYKEANATKVYTLLPAFLNEAEILKETIKKRNDRNE